MLENLGSDLGVAEHILDGLDDGLNLSIELEIDRVTDRDPAERRARQSLGYQADGDAIGVSIDASRSTREIVRLAPSSATQPFHSR